MNKVILMGRVCKDVDARGEGNSMVARYTLAVDRRFKDADGNYPTDFISVVAFGKSAEFAEKYLKKGTKLVVTGRIQTGSYTNKDGQKVYTTDIIAEDQEFAESKRASEENDEVEEAPKKSSSKKSKSKDYDADEDFMNISPEEAADLPW